jgi:LPPG:FO 2-phospho-L-lactate transferase
VRTRVRTRGTWHGFQEFMIRERAEGPVEDVEFAGAAAAAPTPEVLAALERADVIVIGPSNPVISIGPILAVPGMREALAAAPARVVAVSPLVRGAVVKGPTAAFLDWAGWERSCDGIAAAYAGVADALVADTPASELPTLVTDVAMADTAARRRVARAVLDVARDRH